MYYVYILTDQHKKTLYIGVTNDLVRRAYEHREGLAEGFSKKYHVKYLIYYEATGDVRSAIAKEKELKGWKRSKKEALINRVNPEWRDLWKEIV